MVYPMSLSSRLILRGIRPWGVASCLAAAIFCVSSVGCSVSGAVDNGGDPYVGPVDDAAIRFEQEETLALAPGEEIDVTVVTDPAARYAVTFILSGNTLDASISSTRVVAGDDGRATLRLRAPTRATAFLLTATIDGGASAVLEVAVSDQGFGRLQIIPSYNGQRPVGTWQGGMVAGTTCDALAEVLPNDPEGNLSFTGAPGETLEIDTAPVGPNLAVYVRAGHYMWGCTNTDDLEANGSEEITVEVINKPIDASKAALDLDLEFDPDPTGWNDALVATKTAMMAELSSPNPSQLLLDTMESESIDPQGFAAASVNNSWMNALQTHFQSQAVDLEGTFASFYDAGVSSTPPQLLGRIDAVPEAPGFARFTLASVGNASPTDLNVPEEYTISLETTTKDLAKFGGSVFFSASRFAARAVEDEAVAQTAGATDMVDVLAAEAVCDNLPLTGYAACEGACLEQLCRDAIAALWGRARAATDGAGIGEIVMQASGAADYDDYAALTGFSGTWIGQVKQGTSSTVSVEGEAMATPASSGPN